MKVRSWHPLNISLGKRNDHLEKSKRQKKYIYSDLNQTCYSSFSFNSLRFSAISL